MRRSVSVIAALLASVASVLAAQGSGHFQVIAKYKLGGEGGWDYLTVDAPHHHLFISRGSHVMVMDTESGKIAGDIPDTPGVHGIAIADNLDKGFTSNGRGNSITVFSLTTLKVLKTVKIDAQNPDGIIYDPASECVITGNGRSSDATVFNARTDGVVGNIKLDGRPEFPAADGRGGVFINIEDKSEIQKLDVHALKAVATWPLAPGDGPSGLVVDGRRHRLFSTCGNNILGVVDTETGKLVGTPKIGNGPDAAGIDLRLGFTYSSNGEDGTVTVVKRTAKGEYVPSETVATQRSARTMAVDPRTHRLYLAAIDYQGAPAPGQRRQPSVPGSFTIIVVGWVK